MSNTFFIFSKNNFSQKYSVTFQSDQYTSIKIKSYFIFFFAYKHNKPPGNPIAPARRTVSKKLLLVKLNNKGAIIEANAAANSSKAWQ